MAIELQEYRQHVGKFIEITMDNGRIARGKFRNYEFKNPLNWIEEDCIWIKTGTEITYVAPTKNIEKIKILEQN